MLMPRVATGMVIAAVLASCNNERSIETTSMNDSLMLDTINVPHLIDTLNITTSSLANIKFNHKKTIDTLCLDGVNVIASVDPYSSVALDFDLAGKDERSVARLVMALQHRINLMASGTIYSDATSQLSTLTTNKKRKAANDSIKTAIMLQLVDDHLLLNLYDKCDPSALDFLMECINDPSLWFDAEDEPNDSIDDHLDDY